MLKIPVVAAVFLAALPSAWAQTTYTETGDPTNIEQAILEIINRARANPDADETRLGSLPPPIGPLPPGPPTGDITEGLPQPSWVVPKPPLAMNAKLLAAARAHSQDMWTNAYFSHTGTGGTTPPSRCAAAGYAGSGIGENIAAGTGFTPYQHQDDLMIDSGVAGRGHRVNLLDVFTPGTQPYREIGIGWYEGANPVNVGGNNLQNFMTQDFGRNNVDGSLVLGVVYNDTNSNSLYDPGEGMAGVTVTLNPAGTWKAVTGSAGGYSFPAATTAAITVTATGGGFGAAVASKTVTPGFPGQNVKVDFKLSDATVTDSDSDGLADSWETTHFGNLAQTAAGDPDADTYNNLAEFNGGTDPNDPGSVPAPPGPPPATPKKKGGGGGCGLSGLEALLVLALLRRARR